MTGLSDKVFWTDGEPTFEEYDIDNPGFTFGGAKDACPICGELKQVRSVMCLPCYRTSRKEDPNWKGSVAWHLEQDAASSDTPVPEELSSAVPLHISDPGCTFSPTPLDRSLSYCA